MMNLKRILIPTDFSDFSAVAMTYGCALAAKFQAEVHLLHVLEVHAASTPAFGMGLALPVSIQESREVASRKLNELELPGECEHCQVVRVVGEGVPFVEIIRYAREHQIDLITIGTHGRSGLAQVLMGSVAERVVHKANCPVLSVRSDAHQFKMP